VYAADPGTAPDWLATPDVDEPTPMLRVPAVAPCPGLENVTTSRSARLKAKLVADAEGTWVELPMSGASEHPLERPAAGTADEVTAAKAVPAPTTVAVAASAQARENVDR
jgi:hypothetical protein